MIILRILAFFFGNQVFRVAGYTEAGFYVYTRHKNAWMLGQIASALSDIYGPYLNQQDVVVTPPMQVGELTWHTEFHLFKPEGCQPPLEKIEWEE